MTPETEFVCITHPSPELADRGIDCILAGPERGGMARRLEIRARRSSFDALCRQYNISATNQVVCLQNDQVAAAGLWVPNPGKSAICYLPPSRYLQGREAQTAACLKAAAGEAAAAGMKMIQGIFDSEEKILPGIYQSAEYQLLAVLQFMEHTARWTLPEIQLPDDYDLETYRPDTHELFKQAIGASYEQTLDCPAMSGLRSLDEVIVGHQHAGTFDPALWFVLVHQARGVGVLILTYHASMNSLDVTYLGIGHAHRGRHLGSFFMNQTRKIMRLTGARTSTLAVDERNTPAVGLYRKVGYRPTQRREVYFLPLGEKSR